MHDLLGYYVKAASTEEMRRFADVMRSGTEQEQQAAVDAASDKALSSISLKSSDK
jgi:hypothetical protein